MNKQPYEPTIEKPIYPNVQVLFEPFHDGANTVTLTTYLRKRKSRFGKYYLLKFHKSAIIQGPRSLAECVNHFHSEVYRTLLLGKLNAKVVDMHIKPIFEIDECQLDEKERLIKTGI